MTGEALRPKLALLARVILGGLFVYAGVLKFLAPVEFAQEIANYRMLPDVLVGPLAVLLPGVEVVAGLALVLGIALRGGIVLIQGMLVVFIIALVQAIGRGIDTSCGCFGVAEEADPIGWPEVFRDVAMMLAGVLAWPAGSPPTEAAGGPAGTGDTVE